MKLYNCVLVASVLHTVQFSTICGRHQGPTGWGSVGGGWRWREAGSWARRQGLRVVVVLVQHWLYSEVTSTVRQNRLSKMTLV